MVTKALPSEALTCLAISAALPWARDYDNLIISGAWVSGSLAASIGEKIRGIPNGWDAMLGELYEGFSIAAKGFKLDSRYVSQGEHPHSDSGPLMSYCHMALAHGLQEIALDSGWTPVAMARMRASQCIQAAATHVAHWAGHALPLKRFDFGHFEIDTRSGQPQGFDPFSTYDKLGLAHTALPFARAAMEAYEIQMDAPAPGASRVKPRKAL
jgi:hypothetical protein